MVVPTAHTTQHKFVIGQFQTDNSHWTGHFCQNLNQNPPSPNETLTTDMSYTYIFTKYLTFDA